MTEPPIFIPEAKADVADAYLWYEDQSQGLGMEFLRCVEAALLSVQRTPLLYPSVHESYRRVLVRRFPFAIFFEFEQDHNRCVIYSVFHCSQNPEKWLNRFRPQNDEHRTTA
jgi:plasmid stabilization system protein ParE